MQLVYNVLNVVHDAIDSVAIVGVAWALLWRVRRIERALHMTPEDEAAIKRTHDAIMQEVHSNGSV